jgi:hypothetical protein
MTFDMSRARKAMLDLSDAGIRVTLADVVKADARGVDVSDADALNEYLEQRRLSALRPVDGRPDGTQ